MKKSYVNSDVIHFLRAGVALVNSTKDVSVLYHGIACILFVLGRAAGMLSFQENYTILVYQHSWCCSVNIIYPFTS